MTQLNPQSPIVNKLTNTPGIEPSKPLWQRVPTKDENGDYLADFMMLIPKLNKQGKEYIGNTINKISQVLSYYEDIVVFADLNIKVNVLWVSLKPVQGMCVEIPAAIITQVPNAKLVGEKSDFK